MVRPAFFATIEKFTILSNRQMELRISFAFYILSKHFQIFLATQTLPSVRGQQMK